MMVMMPLEAAGHGRRTDLPLDIREHIRSDELDAVTRIPPRKSLDQDIPALLHQMGTRGGPLSALMVDIDDFKKFNDSYGHDVGDMVLLHVAGLIRSAVVFRGEAYRYGGEEITVLLPNASPEEALCTAERICRTVRKTPLEVPESVIDAACDEDGGDIGRLFAAEDGPEYATGNRESSEDGEDDDSDEDVEEDYTERTRPLGVTISIGVSGFPMVAGDELLVTADHALLQAKRNGKDQAVAYSREKSLGWKPNYSPIDVKFPGTIAIREGSFILLTHWFSHRNDPRDLEARGIVDPGQKTRDLRGGPTPPGGLVTSEIRGKVKDVERRQNATFFTLLVEDEVMELILAGLGLTS